MTASSNAPSRPTGRTTLRPIPADLVRPARFYWPLERAKAPSHCDNCGVRLLVSDVPTADHPTTDVACWSCSRLACELVHDSMQRPLTPEQWRALPACHPGRGRPPTGTTS